MPRTRLRRSLAAVATTLASVALMATPAAATTHDAVFTGGVITLTKTNVTVPIDLGPDTSCTPSTLALDENGTTVSVTDLDRSHVVPFLASTLLLVITRSPTGGLAGTLDSSTTPHTITGMRVPFVFTYYNTTSCTPTGTPVCIAAVRLDLNGTTGSVAPSSTFSLTGTSVGTVAAFPTCTGGLSSLLSTTSTVTTPLTGHLTT